MIYSDEFITFLKDKTGLGYFNGLKTEIVCRCPWCEPTSKKSHGHLYIDVDEPTFFCHRCQMNGLVSKLIQALNGEIHIYIDPKVLKKGRVTKTKNKNLFNPLNSSYNIIDNALEVTNFDLKFTYLLGRLPNIDVMSIPGLVMEPIKFVEENNIKISSELSYMLPKLNETYIGFLTSKGTQLMLRNCDATSPNRHFKLKVNNKNLFFNDFYGIRVGDVGVSNTIVLCEGVFDLLVSIGSENFKTLRQQSIYWVASLGKAQFRKVAVSVLDYLKLPKADFVILADEDFSKSDGFFKIKTLPNVGNLEMYWNRYGSDFGCLPIDPVHVSVNWKGKYKYEKLRA